MFVQISPSEADLGETLCSLNFASRVKGIEHGPARKQTDHAELLKYKHLVCFLTVVLLNNQILLAFSFLWPFLVILTDGEVKAR